MKNYEAFKAEVTQKMQEMAQEQRYVLTQSQGYKVNQKFDSISLGDKQNPSVQPTVYVQDMYCVYQQEMGENVFSEDSIIEMIVKDFWDVLTSNMQWAQKMAGNLPDAGNLKDFVTYQVVNAERNREMLKNMPHREFLDLAIIYRLLFEDGSSALVTNGMANDMGMQEDDLYQVAKENMDRIVPTREMTMGSDNRIDMIFLTNPNFLYGAATILDTERLEQIAEKMGNDLFIIPSSIHELVIAPAEEWNKETLEVTLWDANRIVITPDIYLSDTLYRYDRKGKTVRIA